MWPKGKPRTEETKRKLSIAMNGHKFSNERNAKISDSKKGLLATDVTKQNMSIAQLRRYESEDERAKCGNARRDKNAPAHKRTIWTQAVKERDQNICTECGTTGRDAHHIIPKSIRPEAEFDVGNGTCVCHSCHLKLHALINKTFEVEK